MTTRVQAHLELLMERFPVLLPVKEAIADSFALFCKCYENGGKLIVGGNGGSCADAEHIVGELMKGFKLPRELDEEMRKKLMDADLVLGAALADKLQGGLPAVTLASHPGLNTAFLNDINGEMMYAQQVSVQGNPGDVFWAISTSGNSKNMLYAAVAAKAKGMKVVGLTGKKGGELDRLTDVNMIMPCDETYQIQELHLPVYHCLCLMLEEHFFGER